MHADTGSGEVGDAPSSAIFSGFGAGFDGDVWFWFQGGASGIPTQSIPFPSSTPSSMHDPACRAQQKHVTREG